MAPSDIGNLTPRSVISSGGAGATGFAVAAGGEIFHRRPTRMAPPVVTGFGDGSAVVDRSFNQ